MDMADSRLLRIILIDALALRHHFPDNKKRDPKLEMDDYIIPCPDNNRICDLLYNNNYSKAFRVNLI